MSCAHGEVLVEVTHGQAWTLVDVTGDVIDDGLEELEVLRLAVVCGDCAMIYRCTDLSIDALPGWARAAARSVVTSWRRKQYAYQPSTRSKR